MTFEEFAAERLPGVLRFAAILTGDRALAEDLAQEVLIRAHSRWSKIGSLDRPEYYVRKMILNEFLHWRRREWRLIPSGAGSDVDHRSAPDHAVGYSFSFTDSAVGPGAGRICVSCRRWRGWSS